MDLFRSRRRIGTAAAAFAFSVLGGGAGALAGPCSPFSDTAGDAFCPFVLEIFYQGITTGTTPTTYDPTGNVTRLQMAAFLSRTVDGVLKRGSPRAIADKFWTPQGAGALATITVGSNAGLSACDGADVWVSAPSAGEVARVRGSDGRLLGTWTGMNGAWGVLAAIDGVFVTGAENPGRLYHIPAAQAPGAAVAVSSSLGDTPGGIAFDGGRIWTVNSGPLVGPPGGSVSVVLPGASLPWTVTTVTVGFRTPFGILYDGANVWVQDDGALLKLNASGGILQTVSTGPGSSYQLAFDGANLWAPVFDGASVLVVRASSGAILATLTGFDHPVAAAFDGERVLVTDIVADKVSLWKAADLTPIGTFPVGTAQGPQAACTDGFQFWITMRITGKLARF